MKYGRKLSTNWLQRYNRNKRDSLICLVHRPYPHAHTVASVISTDDNGKERKEFLCCFSERVEGAAMSMGSVRVRGWVPFRDNQRKLGLSVDW